MRRRIPSPAFTLIELLVVVTIIVVLLALLVPGMDRAIYQAEFASCAAQQDGVATGVVSYAMSHNRMYPDRPCTRDAQAANYYPMHITAPFGETQKGNPLGYDDRPLLRPYLSVNGLADPLSEAVDLDHSLNGTTVLSSYSLWFGWKYASSATPTRGMQRYGQGWSWAGRKYNTLLGDTHGRWPLQTFYSSHADRTGGYSQFFRQDMPRDSANPSSDRWTFSAWKTGDFVNPPPDKIMDLNFAFEDGSVAGYRDTYGDTDWYRALQWEERLDTVPLYQRVEDAQGSTNYPLGWLAVPRGR